MPANNRSLNAIEEFLALKRFAMVGISREPKDFSVSLFEELCRRGYDVVPVNPKTPNVMGKSCYARVQDIQPPVEGALLMTSTAHTDAVVADCAQAGIRKVWMYRAAGAGAVSEKAVEFCREHGIEVIPGECPFMFLPHAGGVHKLHGFFRKITGRFPTRGRNS
ncbi:MAG: CoA-binding protein [Candidatus Sulfotelmatobacter sp.]